MSFNITSLLDTAEFSDRWRRARIAAIRAVLDQEATNHICDQEDVLLSVANEEGRPRVLRKVFENSRKLGESAKWFYGVECEESDFGEICAASAIPCFRGAWAQIPEGISVSGAGCTQGEALGSFLCEYYKEAAYGLSLGFADGVRYVRHESVRSNGSQCKDLFLKADAAHLFFGPLPEAVSPHLEAIRDLCAVRSLSISFPGQIEGEIVYQWKSVGAQSCEDHSVTARSILSEYVVRLGLDLRFRDVTPRAILSPGAQALNETKNNVVQIGKKKVEARWNQIVS